jgi:hypothetical protein
MQQLSWFYELLLLGYSLDHNSALNMKVICYSETSDVSIPHNLTAQKTVLFTAELLGEIASLVRSILTLKYLCNLSGLAESTRTVITRYRDGLSNPKGQVNTNVINYLINKPSSTLMELLIPRRYCNNNYELQFIIPHYILGDYSILSSESNEHF